VTPPKWVQIGPHRYELVISANAIAAANRLDGELRLGLTDHRHLRMHVCDDQAETMVKETTFHEILHACWAGAAIGSQTGPTAFSAEVEESVIGALSPILFGALRANKGLVSWLTS
jgi:hypothetical protein